MSQNSGHKKPSKPQLPTNLKPSENTKTNLTGVTGADDPFQSELPSVTSLLLRRKIQPKTAHEGPNKGEQARPISIPQNPPEETKAKEVTKSIVINPEHLNESFVTTRSVLIETNDPLHHNPLPPTQTPDSPTIQVAGRRRAKQSPIQKLTLKELTLPEVNPCPRWRRVISLALNQSSSTFTNKDLSVYHFSSKENFKLVALHCQDLDQSQMAEGLSLAPFFSNQPDVLKTLEATLTFQPSPEVQAFLVKTFIPKERAKGSISAIFSTIDKDVTLIFISTTSAVSFAKALNETLKKKAA